MKIKNLLLTFLFLAAMAGNVDAQTKSTPIVQDFETAVYPCFEEGNYPFQDSPCMNGWMYFCADDDPYPEDPDDAVFYGFVSSVDVDELPGHESTYCFCLDHDANYGFLVSPNLTGCGFSGAVSVSFYHRVRYESVTFEVLYSMDDIQVGDEIDYDSFTWKADITANVDWDVYLDNFPIGVKHIVIASRGGEPIYPYVDDITIEEATGGCVTPSGLEATPTKTSLGLSWAGGSPSYELRYKAGSCNTFESGFEGWTTIDADGVGHNGDGYNWTLSAAGSNRYIYSESLHFEGTQEISLTPNNYLVSPLVPLGGSITFWAKARDDAEHFGVAVSTTGNTSDKDFLTIFNATVETQNWTKYTVDLTDYSGEMGYIAIRHYDCVPDWQLCVDDVTIFTPSAWTSVNGITNTTYTLNGLMFETMYDIQVRGDCGADGYSDWAEVYAMTSNANCRFVNAGNWNVESNWRNNSIPTADSDVAIAAAATIPADYIASANDINLSLGSITIQDGGQLKHNNAGVVVTAEKSITAYPAYPAEGKAGYYLIASPLADDFTPTADNGFLTGDYDLYRFNQDATDEWENWKKEGSDHYHFNLENGKGYLYANSDDVTLNFTGAIKPSNSSVTVTGLGYTENAEFEGWNLVGNPFMCNANIDRGTDFYVVNGDGDEVIATQSAIIAPLQGVFVKATSDNTSVTFSKAEAQGLGSVLNVNVFRNESNVDVARVRFGEGQGLEKFQLNPSHTKVYFTQNGKNYAVVNANGIDELPCNFKAEEDGTYTLSFTKEQVEFNYLHLIDNMTGADIDLLQQPEYTFEAKNDDYASRFRVVFVAKDTEGIAEDSETFAFNSYGSWIIVNEGLATLQMVDINGRVLRNEQIEGYTSMKFNVAPGVYVLRLVNGENVRVQKVIVR